jgi:hypothetical protein
MDGEHLLAERSPFCWEYLKNLEKSPLFKIRDFVDLASIVVVGKQGVGSVKFLRTNAPRCQVHVKAQA